MRWIRCRASSRPELADLTGILGAAGGCRASTSARWSLKLGAPGDHQRQLLVMLNSWLALRTMVFCNVVRHRAPQIDNPAVPFDR